MRLSLLHPRTAVCASRPPRLLPNHCEATGQAQTQGHGTKEVKLANSSSFLSPGTARCLHLPLPNLPDHSDSATLPSPTNQPQCNPYLLPQQIMKLTGVVLTAFLASPITLAAMLRGDIHQRVLIDETVDKGTVVPHSETEGDKTYGYGFGGGGGQQQQQQQQQQQGGGGWGGGGQQQQQQQQGGGGWGGGDQQQQQQQQQGGRGWRLLAEEAEPDNANVGTKVGVPIEEGQDKEQQQQQQQMNGPFGTMQQQVCSRVEKKSRVLSPFVRTHISSISILHSRVAGPAEASSNNSSNSKRAVAAGVGEVGSSNSSSSSSKPAGEGGVDGATWKVKSRTIRLWTWAELPWLSPLRMLRRKERETSSGVLFLLTTALARALTPTFIPPRTATCQNFILVGARKA